jgi:hypothetical protein
MAGSIFSNPIDAATLFSPRAIAPTMGVLGKVPDVHMLVYHLGFHPISRWGGGRLSSTTFLQGVIAALTEARDATGKPVLLALRPAPNEDGARDFFAAQEAFVRAGFPVFHSLSQAARAMARIVAWKRG